MKYMGSKARIVNDILPFMLDYNYDNFYDVFCGSCSVVQEVPIIFNRIANDKNGYLIAMWKFLTQTKLEFPTIIKKESYARWRSIYNHKKTPTKEFTSDDAMIGWVGFMGSYNGRFYDGGYSGHEVKVKNGFRDYIGENIRNIFNQIPKLKDVQFTCSDYKDLPIYPNSILYCDPPYRGVKKYSYSIDHDEFWQWCREKVNEGHKVFVSEYNAPDDFVCIWQGKLKTCINQTITKDATEKLFIHKSQL